MRIIDHTTGRSLHRVGSEEEAHLALVGIAQERLRRAMRGLLVCAYDNGEAGALRRSLADAAQATTVLGGALWPPVDDPIGSQPWRIEYLFFAPFAPHNTATWPVTVAELRRTPDLADAPLGALAEHLNTRLHGDAAAVLANCAHYRANGTGETLGDRIRGAGDLAAATMDEVVDAVRSGGRCWTARGGWEPRGGVDGDPFLVARYAWGPLRAAAKLDSHELLTLHLAGDADLALFRTIIDAGGGRTEFIWPAQRFVCCGRDWPLAGGARIPLRTAQWADRDSRWGAPETLLWAQGVQCMICGAVSYPSWLTRRAVEDDAGPLAVIEPLDELPPAALAAAAAAGLRAITSNHPAGDR